MIIRVAFIGLLFLGLFYGLLRLAFAAPFAKVRSVVWAFIKRLVLVLVAAFLTGVAISIIVSVDHLF